MRTVNEKDEYLNDNDKLKEESQLEEILLTGKKEILIDADDIYDKL